MATENYYTSGDEFLQNYQKDPHHLMKYRSPVNRAASRAYGTARYAYNNLPQEHQKEAQRKLGALQKSAPTLAKNLAAGKPSAIVSLAGNLLAQIDWSKDWMFFLLISFALLKDIFDIVFGFAATAASWIPILGEVTAAIGIILTFVGEIMILLLTVTTLVLTGSSLKNRGMAKYFMWVPVAFLSEALPGIGLLPLCCIEAIVLFGFVLWDRAYQAQEEGTGSVPEEIPAYAAADGYEEKLAA
jgi:hypothetical protein